MTDSTPSATQTPPTVGVVVDSSAIELATARLASIAQRAELIRNRVHSVSQPLPAGADEVSVGGAEALGARSTRLLDALGKLHQNVLDDSARLAQINAEYNETDESNARRFEQVRKA